MMPPKKHVLTTQEAISKQTLYKIIKYLFWGTEKLYFNLKNIKEMEGVFAFYSKGSSTIKRDDALKVIKNLIFTLSNISLQFKTIAIKVIQSVGQNPSLKEFKEALNVTQLNKQERISLSEQRLLLELIWSEHSLESILKDSFRRFDKDGTGYYNQKENKFIYLKLNI